MLSPRSAKDISKFLSLVLRHEPAKLGITLDAGGWVEIDDLLLRSEKAGMKFDRVALVEVVETNDKKRFTISDDGRLIRAAQGHSVAVELGLVSLQPPEELFHGTTEQSVQSILASGLKPGKRQKVHLSLDESTAETVGRRHGRPVLLLVAAGKMHREGFEFWKADNGVWLTDAVPVQFLKVI
ncbi:RNA 2'-phosphotransferase [Phyllobacterium sp. YR531]|uniref:RNA 2'-phosphotransferase n=1 Tax=Phyllobacterium sp. YR531 TaxID=1144343 RepID=UPI00026F9073|nr:RNA 2'-phosphotransferase [Phyllobacterium sp. YR531]EJM98460.1 RNA:NAD 2'-phosphotransferase [Phyllobacterium sp. YR531]